MSTALFNPPQPKNWIYIVLLTLALLITALLNGCKSRKLDKESSKLVDKTEQFSVVSKKDSANSVLKKSETIETNTKTFKKDSGVVITEKTKTTLFDSLGKIKSVVENIKIIDKKGLSKSANSRDFRTAKTDVSQIKTNKNDSTGKKINDIKKSDQLKKVEVKPDTLKNWVGFEIFCIILGSVLIWYLRK